MVICLRLEIDDAFESDLKTLDYIVYQGIFLCLNLFIHDHKLLFQLLSTKNPKYYLQLPITKSFQQ
jgi:hypothetical protein